MTVGWSAHQHDADQQARHAQVYDKNSFKGEELIGAATWFLPPPNAPPWKVVRVRLHPPSGGGWAGSAGEVVFSAQRVRVEVRMACCNSECSTCSCSAVEKCCDLHSACALRRACPISFLSTVMLARLPSLLSKAVQMLHIACSSCLLWTQPLCWREYVTYTVRYWSIGAGRRQPATGAQTGETRIRPLLLAMRTELLARAGRVGAAVRRVDTADAADARGMGQQRRVRVCRANEAGVAATAVLSGVGPRGLRY